jgi:hypothetical protein
MDTSIELTGPVTMQTFTVVFKLLNIYELYLTQNILCNFDTSYSYAIHSYSVWGCPGKSKPYCNLCCKSILSFTIFLFGPSSGIYCHVIRWVSTDISEKHLAYCACYLLHVAFILGLSFDPEDGGDMFLRNIGWLSTDCTALYPRKQNYS